MSFELSYDAFLRTIKENNDSNHAFLLGAGASISSGVQSAIDCIWEWKRNIFISKNPSLSKQYQSFQSESVQKSLQKWIDTEGTYPPENSEEEYSYFAQVAYPIEETRRKYFENICKGKEPFVGYRILCELSKKGLVKSVFTTNFDGLVEKAAYQTGITPIPVSLATAEYIHRVSSNTELLCVALHGDYKYGQLKNTSTELDTQRDTFVTAIKQHLYDKHLVVIGYSGRDKSLMNALKCAYSEAGGGMLFWCGYGNQISPNVKELLEHIHSKGRQGFYIPTEGFDTTMIHIAKTCYDNDTAFHNEISKHLQSVGEDTIKKTPFKLDVTEQNILLRSNLFPILLPREVFQTEVSFPPEKVWQTVRNLTGDKKIYSVPLRGCLYSFGTQSEIREAYASIIKGDIKRTPVTYKEIKEDSSFRNLYLSTIIRGISELVGLETNGKDKIWRSTDNYISTKDDVSYVVYDAVELGLFFDDNTFTAHPYCYLSINPTFYIKSDNEVPKSVRFEIGKAYHENLLKGKPNVKFNGQIQKWINVLFPQGNKLQFEYPLNSGTGFKFFISTDTMHVALMKNSNPKYRLNLPSGFSQRKIIHKGIQYGEPLLEFTSKSNGNIVYDFHPMRGLRNNKPYDYSLNGNVFDPEVNLAIICPSSYNQDLYSFLNRLNQTVKAGINNPDYLLDYPGFSSAYGIPLNIPDLTSELWKNCEASRDHSSLPQAAIGLADNIKRTIDQLEAIRKKTVMIIFIPTVWNDITNVETEDEKFDLHDYIKAYAAQKQIATQFIQEETLLIGA